MKQRSEETADTGLRILSGIEDHGPEESLTHASQTHPTPGPGRLTRLRSWLGAKRYRKGVAAAIAALLCAAVGILYMSTASSAASRYRFASAVQTNVTQVMSLSGTLSPTSSANVVFPTGGTVARVNVRVGQRVQAGQTLAQLDTTQLSAQVTQAQSSVAQAELNLYNLENGISSGGSGGGDFSAQSSSAQSSSAQSSKAQSSTSTTSAVVTQVSMATGSSTGLQQQVQQLQAELKRALSDSQRDIERAEAACRATPSPSPTASASKSAPAPAPTSTTSSDSQATQVVWQSAGSSNDNCARAQQQVQQGQVRIQQLQSKLSSAIAALSRANQNTPAPSTGGGGTGMDSGSGTNSSGTNSSESGSSATSEEIDAAEASLVAAQASLAVAEQNLAAASITSPITGTVLSVPFVNGAKATTTDAIVITGSTQFQASLSVDVSKIAQVKAGQTANIVPSGSTETIRGTVSAIGAAPTTSDSTTTYPVTVTLAGTHNNLRSGSSASVEIVTAKADDVTAVPTSALRTNANGSAVRVLRDGAQTSQNVTVGAIGATYAEIVNGLKPGDQIILADLDEPIPTSGTTTRFSGGMGGSFPGGGFPGGGMPNGMSGAR